jgi:hypothetical protein
MHINLRIDGEGVNQGIKALENSGFGVMDLIVYLTPRYFNIEYVFE